MVSNMLNIFWELDYFFFDKSLNFFKITTNSLYFLNLILLKYIFLIILFFVIVNVLVFCLSKSANIQNMSISSTNFLKFCCLSSFFASMFLLFIYIYIYLFIISALNNKYLNNYFMTIPSYHFFSININFDFFGLILLLIAYFAGLLSFLALDNKFYWKNIKYLCYLNIFILIVFFYVTTNNILVLFLFYEFLLIPSFLLVFYLSPSRKSTQASLYFVIWTQIGSFLVLCVVFYIITVTGCSNFFLIKNYIFTKNEIFFLSLFLFLGFGFKVPIWPFHYWLTKTHVEAPSGFSMYLSGFLVKTALFGYYKIINLFGGEQSSVLFSTICLLGIIDSSLKMWGQTDLKKLVAYGTVQEMNIIYLTFCWGDSSNIISGILFCVTHAFLSVLMFYLVDCIYRRYYSRSVIELSGILQKTPNLGIAILLMCTFYAGLPGTLKFSTEFFIFSSFIEVAPFSAFLIIFIANCLGLIGFSKSWFNVVYGMSLKNNQQLILDLTIKESLIILITLFVLFFFCFFSNIIF